MVFFRTLNQAGAYIPRRVCELRPSKIMVDFLADSFTSFFLAMDRSNTLLATIYLDTLPNKSRIFTEATYRFITSARVVSRFFLGGLNRNYKCVN